MKHSIRFLITSLLILSFFEACTDNGLFDDKVNTQNKRSISGVIKLSGETDHSGIFIYLEGFELSTETATDGSFKLTIPGNASAQPISGAYKMYFYMDNYSFKSVDILARDGQLEYGHADLNNKGELTRTVTLQKLLDITVGISPQTIPADFSGTVIAIAQLSVAGNDTIDVRTVQAKPMQFSGLFLINVNKPSDIHIVSTSARMVDTEVHGSEKWDMIIQWEKNSVPFGTYEVVPFIKLLHPNFPSVLNTALGVNSANFTTDFLNIPQRRKTTRLTITEIQ